MSMKGMMSQLEAAAMAQEMQEMAYMFPMSSYMFQASECGGGSTSEGGSPEEVPVSWGSLWNLDDDVHADAVQDRLFSFY